MRPSSALVFAALLAGCSDYHLTGNPNIYGTPNPPDLSAPTQTDKITQVTTPSVDVLWVIDNSCSMEDKQKLLATNFPKFMDYFLNSGLDYHIGVVSTDLDNKNQDGKLRVANGVNYIDPTMDATTTQSTFSAMAKLGINGSSTERGIGGAYLALTAYDDTNNAGFIRPDASLSIITISDEDDQTSPKTVGASGPSTVASTMADFLKGFKSDPSMVQYSGLVGPPNKMCSGASWTAVKAPRYNEVISEVGGIYWEICNPAWDQALTELGMAAAGLKREFYLEQIPVVSTIQVWVIDQDGTRTDFASGTDYTYDPNTNSITFTSYIPAPLADVNISYELLSAWGSQTDTGS